MQQAVLDSTALEPLLVSLVDKVVTRLSTTARVETITFGELFTLYYEKHVKIRLKNWQKL